MKSIKTLLLSCAAFILTACGTQIQMTAAMPGKINFGKGTSLYVETVGDVPGGELMNSVEEELLISLHKAFMRSSYYNLTGLVLRNGIRLLGVVTRAETKSNNQGTGWLEIDIKVIGYRGGYSEVFSNCYQKRAYSFGSGYQIAAACDSVAADVVRDIEPHLYTYYEKVNGHKENPSIELAAKSCAAGHWNQGESYALEALKVNPNEAEAYFVLGLVERNRRNWDASNSYFEKAASADPSNAKYRNAILRNGSFRRNEEAYNAQMR